MDRPASPRRCARVKSFADVASLTVRSGVAGLPDCRVSMRRHRRPGEDHRMRKYLKFYIDHLQIKGTIGYGPRSRAD